MESTKPGNGRRGCALGDAPLIDSEKLLLYWLSSNAAITVEHNGPYCPCNENCIRIFDPLNEKNIYIPPTYYGLRDPVE